MQRRSFDDRQPSSAKKPSPPATRGRWNYRDYDANRYQDDRESVGMQGGWNENQRKEWEQDEYDTEFEERDPLDLHNRFGEAFGNPWRYETSHLERYQPEETPPPEIPPNDDTAVEQTEDLTEDGEQKPRGAAPPPDPF